MGSDSLWPWTLGASAVVLCLLTYSPASAETTHKFNIPAQDLRSALYQFSLQSGQQLAYAGPEVSGRRSRALKGSFSTADGLKRLLEGNHLAFAFRESGIITLTVERPTPPAPTPRPPTPVQKAAEAGPAIVIVMATRKPTKLKDVPAGGEALRIEQLGESGIATLADVPKAVPTLSIIQGDSPANSALAIGGIGTVAFSIAVQPSVSVQVDEVPVAFQARNFIDLPDIERIEVLRQPQNPLYGMTSSAGTIAIFTGYPKDKFTLSASTLTTSDDETQASVSVAGPLLKTLSYRLSTSVSDYPGPVDNLTLGKRVDGKRDASYRLKLKWLPEPATSILLTTWRDRNKSTCCAYTYAAVPTNAVLDPDGGPVSSPQSVFLNGIRPGESNATLRQDTPTFANILDAGASLKIDHTLKDGSRLISLTSTDSFLMNDQIDSDAGILPDYAVRQIAAGQVSQAAYNQLITLEPHFLDYPGQGNVQFGTFKSRADIEELRFVSPPSQRLRYLFGAFFSSANNSLDRARGPVFIPQRWNATSSTEEAATFAQVDWSAAPKTVFSAAVRTQIDRVGYSFDDLLAHGYYSGHETETATTFRLSGQRTVSNDTLIYAAIGNGVKVRAYDLSDGFDQARADKGPIAPERSMAYEMGFRKAFQGGKSSFNVTAFKIDYHDLQTQAIDYATSTFFLTNVDSIHTQGLEVSSNGYLTERWRGTVSASLLDAKIDRYDGADCYPGQTVANGCLGTPGRQDIRDKPLPNAPKVKLNATTDYTFNAGAHGYLKLAAAYRWQSRTGFAMDQDPNAFQKAFGIFDVSASFENPKKHYTLTAFVNNLLNAFYVTTRETGGRTLPYSVIQVPARDAARYAGLRLSVNY